MYLVNMLYRHSIHVSFDFLADNPAYSQSVFAGWLFFMPDSVGAIFCFTVLSSRAFVFHFPSTIIGSWEGKGSPHPPTRPRHTVRCRLNHFINIT